MAAEGYPKIYFEKEYQPCFPIPAVFGILKIPVVILEW
jgi:hypothetical protein